MRELERRYPNELTVVGVHSGKYIAERVTERIRDATLRLDVVHPVVNDRQYRIWRSYAVNAWPTLVVVDPRGRVVGQHAGEFEAGQVAPFLEGLIESASAAGELERSPLHFAAEQPTLPPGELRYPGKVAVDGSRIAISDSGHHRVLIGTLDDSGRTVRVTRVLGSGTPGFADGDRPSFNSPQGLAFSADTLYVADAENHAIRAVSIQSGAVRTLAGTGRQLRTRADVEQGALSSPWDVVAVGDSVYVAMAGTHQLYAIPTATGTPRVHSGNGREDILDGAHAEAMLAQPMGIASHGAELYFADSESSAVRRSDLASTGGVHTYVGTGLFDFGDRDGVGDAARMQHQQGAAWHGGSGRLLVADSYNDALKWVDPETREAVTWVRGLHEPGGVACGERFAYVADTNAHRLCSVDYASGEVSVVSVVMPRDAGPS